MKISKRQLKRIIREEKRRLLEISGPKHFEDLKNTVEELIQDYMLKSGQNRKMAIYEIDLALSNQKSGRNIQRTK